MEMNTFFVVKIIKATQLLIWQGQMSEPFYRIQREMAERFVGPQSIL